jgi:hypothetical protein
MKTELINFLKEVIEGYEAGTVTDVELYNKATELINSEHQGEARNISDNEHTKENFYRLKYEKCIKVIKRFDPGIIGMYDL